MALRQGESRWAQRLRDSGLRVTPARLGVLEVLEDAGEPCAALDVVGWLGEGLFDRVTVYRTLHALVEVGLATRSDPGDRVWRFALVQDEHAAHAHLVCDACGSVTCVDEATISAAPRHEPKKRRFKLEARGATLHGTCENCLGT